MGKHAWGTGGSAGWPGAPSAERFARLAAAGPARRPAEGAATAGAGGGFSAVPAEAQYDASDTTHSDGAGETLPGRSSTGKTGTEHNRWARTRWRLPVAASCLVLGLVLSSVLVVLLTGGFGSPERPVTRVNTGVNGVSGNTGGTEVAGMQQGAAGSTAPPKTSAGSTGPLKAGAGSEGPKAGPNGGFSNGIDLGSGADVRTNVPDASAPAVIHVAGAVQHPGIVTLAAGSRVHQAIEAAGGATAQAKLSALNLAALLQDGQQLYVPTHQEAEEAGYAALTGPPAGAAGTGAVRDEESSTLVNINGASAEELGTLPRVGPVLSQRIVDWRTAHGAFTSVDQLDAVPGIGPKMLDALRDVISF